MKNFAFFILLAVLTITQTTWAQPPPIDPPVQAPPVDPNPPPVASDMSEPIAVPGGWKFGLGLGLGLMNGAGFSDVKTSGPAGHASGDTSLTLTPSFSLTAETRWLQPFSWGAIGGATIDSEKRFFKQNFKNDGTYDDLGKENNKDAARFRFVTAHLSAARQWRNWYVPLGLNYSWVTANAAKDFQGSMEASGGLGLQSGIGLLYDENITFDFNLRILALKLKSTSDAGTVVDYGNGSVVDLMASVKYFF